MSRRSQVKKLKDAVRHLLDGNHQDRIDPEIIKKLKAGAAKPEVIARYEQRAAKGDFEVHYDNWDIVRWFLKVQSQWRYAGMHGVRVGLDYTACEAAARMMGIPADQDHFAGLWIMEAEALKVFNERSKSRHKA